MIPIIVFLLSLSYFLAHVDSCKLRFSCFQSYSGITHLEVSDVFCSFSINLGLCEVDNKSRISLAASHVLRQPGFSSVSALSASQYCFSAILFNFSVPILSASQYCFSTILFVFSVPILSAAFQDSALFSFIPQSCSLCWAWSWAGHQSECYNVKYSGQPLCLSYSD